jgi:hypothetical protein
MKLTKMIVLFVGFALFQQCDSKKESFRKDILSNDYAIVTHVSLAPGEDLDAPHKNLSLIYSLSSYTMEWKDSDGNTGTKEWNPGDIHVHQEVKPFAKNIGNTVAEWIVFQNTIPFQQTRNSYA